MSFDPKEFRDDLAVEFQEAIRNESQAAKQRQQELFEQRLKEFRDFLAHDLSIDTDDCDLSRLRLEIGEHMAIVWRGGKAGMESMNHQACLVIRCQRCNADETIRGWIHGRADLAAALAQWPGGLPSSHVCRGEDGEPLDKTPTLEASTQFVPFPKRSMRADLLLQALRDYIVEITCE